MLRRHRAPAPTNRSPGMTPACPDEFIAFAHRLADANAAITLGYFQKGVAIENKRDDSPVTIADREGEAAMRRMIREAYPDHGIIGEEHGTENEGADYVWTLDPVDGTAAFVVGSAMFGTLVALLHEGRPILGLIDNPPLKQRWIGAAGRPTTFCGRPAKVRSLGRLEEATLSCASAHYFYGHHRNAYYRLAERVRLPAYGHFCIGYGLLAAGFVDIVVDGAMMPYDYLPLVPVVAGAGGLIADWQGNAVTALRGKMDQIIAAASPALLEEALAELAKRPD